MPEPFIQIGNHVLTTAQAMAVRVAITSFHSEVADPEYRRELGPIGEAYWERLGEVLAVIIREAGASQ